MTKYSYIIFIGYNNSNEFYSQTLPIEIFKTTTSSKTFGIANNSPDVSRYINLYYVDVSNIRTTAGNRFTLTNIYLI